MDDTEYISKDSVLACFSDWIDRYGHEHTADEMVEYQRIEDLPAADVRPVVHGAWKPNPRNPYWLDCTVCGYGKPERMVYNICPNCGADMREANLDTTKGDTYD